MCLLSANVKKYNSTTRHLRYSYISILTNLLRRRFLRFLRFFNEDSFETSLKNYFLAPLSSSSKFLKKRLILGAAG